jgi:hypothetical protein
MGLAKRGAVARGLRELMSFGQDARLTPPEFEYKNENEK